MNRRDALKLFAGTPIAAALEDVPEVEKIERMRLDVGDTIVVSVEGDMPTSRLAILKRQISFAFPGIHVLVLAPGISLSVFNERIRGGFMSVEEIRKREDSR